jgi:hypothetical protein
MGKNGHGHGKSGAAEKHLYDQIMVNTITKILVPSSIKMMYGTSEIFVTYSNPFDP